MPIHKTSLFHLKPTYELITSEVLFSLGFAVAIVGIPLYLINLGLNDVYIGLFTGLISLLIAGLALYLPPILEKYNQRKLFIFSSFFASAAFTLFGFSANPQIALIFLALAQIALHVNSTTLGVLFKDSTRGKKEFTKDTGLLGSFANLGWFIGPLLGGLALSTFGFKGLFILAGFLILLGGLYTLLFPFKTVVKTRPELDVKVKRSLKFYLANPQLRIAYLQKLGIDFWWGFVWTFIPIFMLREHYSPAVIGLFIALTQLPLFLFEFKTVNFVFKYGFRRIFILSYASLALICFASFFFFNSYFIVVLGLLLLGSIALSFLEPISNLFFFSKVSLLEEEKAYPIYSTSFPVGDMVSKITLGLVLLVFYDNILFLVAGLILCFIAYRAIFIDGKPVKQSQML